MPQHIPILKAEIASYHVKSGDTRFSFVIDITQQALKRIDAYMLTCHRFYIECQISNFFISRLFYAPFCSA